jgi:hypothetical protein
MGTAEQIYDCIENMKTINKNKDKSIRNLLEENTKLHAEILAWRYASALIFIASVIAYALTGQ